jgi:subtilase family protein
MWKHGFASVLMLLVLLSARSAHAFIDPPYLTPEHPIAGETVSVNIREGICDAIIGLPGWPQITQDGNAIRILFWAVRNSDPILCNYSIGTGTYAVGSYVAGSYELQVDLRYFDDMGEVVEESLGVLPFAVAGGATPPPVSAPTLSKEGLGTLVLGFAGFTLWMLRSRRSGWLIVALIVLPLGSQAQDAPRNRVIELLVTTAPGAPTPEEIVAYYQHPHGRPPLEGLNVENPLTVQYLIARRAEGDFLARLREHSDSARARLERYLLIVYPEQADLDRALTALRADPYVAKAYEPVPTELSSATLVQFEVDSEVPLGGDYGREALNIDAAWQLTGGGYALVADIDSGIHVDSPALRQFTGSLYTGGNFIPIASLDVGGTGVVPAIPVDANVDEREPVWIVDPACSPAGPSFMASIVAGHGTHTAGLIAANGGAGLGVQGTCKECGLSAWKVTYTNCRTASGEVRLNYNPTANAAALGFMGDIGTQVVSMSFGGDRIANLCGQGNFPNDYDGAMCDAIEAAYLRDIAMVAASGNQRKRIQFPASDTRVIAVGGFQQNLAPWDESPGTTADCPYIPGSAPGAECGENFTTPSNGPKQELMGSSKSVPSTTYPGFNWNEYVECGDGFPGPGWGNGVGLCTGTSMSAPQIAGFVGLVRSIHPLVPVGKPTFNPNIDAAPSLRYVLASTTAEAQAGQAWTPKLGYGRPDAAAAARKMLGTVAGVTVRNRATPLFRFYSAGAKDYADTTSPQTGAALIGNTKFSWQPSGPLVPGYPAFPNDPAEGALPAPRAAIYVMTTDVKPRAEWPALVPLHVMDKNFPASGQVDDFLLVTTVAHIEYAHSHGYNLRGIQGYVCAPCALEPACIPPGAQKLWRACKTADNDCATFLESERGAFETNGYTAAYPPGSNKRLGYAYPATDTDHDGLSDGFEYVVGTNPNLANSDNDTTPDAAEFPMVGVPVSDPCGGVGSAGARYCGADSIFKNGFDLP